jgi:chromosome segregation ATPase
MLYQGASEAELVESRSKIDNLTAQLLSAEEMLEHKETDLRKSHEHKKSLASELETVPLLKQQVSNSQHTYMYALAGRGTSIPVLVLPPPPPK